MTYVTFSPHGYCQNNIILAFSSLAVCYSPISDNPYFYDQKNKKSAVSRVLKGALPNCNMPQNLGGIQAFCSCRGVRQSPALHVEPLPGVALLSKAGLTQQKEGFQGV